MKRPTKKEAVLRNSILGALRRCFSRCYIRREVLDKAKHPTKKGPRGGKLYICAACRDAFSGNKVQVDHKDPVIPLDKTIHDLDWNTVIDRLFCDASNLQVVCTVCHKKKTAMERKERARLRKLQ